MEQVKTPLPIPNPDTEPFWQGCARGELLLQQCLACAAYRHPPSPICPQCLSGDHAWIPACGRGIVYSFVIVHQAFPGWQGEVPYAVAIIELDEGPRILSNVVGVGLEKVRIGMAVTVVFERLTEEITLPKFRAMSD